ncbi:MAG: zf-HC2 domain-containing protein [Acidobacteria bacterium]|nr:zf-HC2 domain-containing protein [Acidobacteriota bacterium]
MEKCFDEGTLQAFLDNELDSGEARRVSRHIADCVSCAELLAVVEEETAFVFGALDPELNTLVPTQRLWTKINDSIRGEERGGWLRPLTAMLSQFSLPTVAAYGSLLIVAGSFAFFLLTKQDDAMTAMASRSANISFERTRSEPVVDSVAPSFKQPADDFQAVRAVLGRPDPSRRIRTDRDTAAVVTRFVEGEETYVKTISNLERTVDKSKDALLSPSSRFAYEKDLAVINDAITRMRREVRRNPKSDIARQVLLNSYQNKIDLLNSVNGRGELMASMR